MARDKCNDQAKILLHAQEAVNNCKEKKIVAPLPGIAELKHFLLETCALSQKLRSESSYSAGYFIS